MTPRVHPSLHSLRAGEAIFPRQQSREMRSRDWEERLQPARPWLNDILTLLCGLVVLGVVLCALPFAAEWIGGAR